MGGSAYQGSEDVPPPYCSLGMSAKEIKVSFAQPDGSSTVSLKQP